MLHESAQIYILSRTWDRLINVSNELSLQASKFSKLININPERLIHIYIIFCVYIIRSLTSNYCTLSMCQIFWSYPGIPGRQLQFKPTRTNTPMGWWKQQTDDFNLMWWALFWRSQTVQGENLAVLTECCLGLASAEEGGFPKKFKVET